MCVWTVPAAAVRVSLLVSGGLVLSGHDDSRTGVFDGPVPPPRLSSISHSASLKAPGRTVNPTPCFVSLNRLFLSFKNLIT